MANLSNINNILRVSSSGVGINKNNTGPSELDIESAGADMIDMTRTNLKTYRLAISGTSDFSIFDVAANDDRLTIDSSGDVGIGTNSPVLKLEVQGTASSPTPFGSAAVNGVVRIASGGTNPMLDIGSNSAAPYEMWLQAHVPANTYGTPISLQPLGGNVGIGETDPKAKLNVTGVSGTPAAPTAGVSAGIFRVESSNAGVGLDIGQQPLAPYSMWMQVGNTSNSTGDTYPLLLNPIGGNVGIGTTSPTQKLEVTGNFKLNGTVVQEGTGNNLTFKYRTANSNSYTGGNANCKFGRFYWTPAHWVTGAPVIKVTLHCKYYQGERREYIIKAGYADNEAIINELQPSSTSQRITLVVGTKTAAGYNYAGQPVYYVDLQWVQTSYMWGWAQVESQVAFLTSNPTSGWGGVVMDSAITQTNGGLVTNYNSFFAGKVGIGTDSPLTTLHVNQANDAQVLVQGTNKMALHQDAAWNSNILLGCYYDGSNIVYGSTNRGAFKIVGLHDSTTQPQTLSIYGANGAAPAGSTVTFNSVGFSQDEDGNVGIGTVSPNAKLEVNVASTDGILIKSVDVATIKMKGSSSTYNWGLATTNLVHHDFGIYKSSAGGGDPISAGNSQLYFKNTSSTTSDVGIGTATPTQKLDVAGIVKHEGLDMSSGPQVDQATTFNVTLVASANTWTDIPGIVGSDIPSSGHYMVGCYSDARGTSGWYYAYWTTYMAWNLTAGTNTTEFSEMPLTYGAHSTNGNTLQLRTSMQNGSGGTSNQMRIQFKVSFATTGTSLRLIFRRLI